MASSTLCMHIDEPGGAARAISSDAVIGCALGVVSASDEPKIITVTLRSTPQRAPEPPVAGFSVSAPCSQSSPPPPAPTPPRAPPAPFAPPTAPTPHAGDAPEGAPNGMIEKIVATCAPDDLALLVGGAAAAAAAASATTRDRREISMWSIRTMAQYIQVRSSPQQSTSASPALAPAALAATLPPHRRRPARESSVSIWRGWRGWGTMA